ncbi:MAG: tRNA pseudouridine(38-40) synthase TruA [Dethiobacter sp.]|jgi:tRNA pseudouridine38-40 synthase|nr:tRNA pseudouridine(38-40) synthase TruA [Dethiobacter sp.]MBS3988466.1 tRNA pseudouridine(38-40) synthase TruA [Dethiobacter sp.]
MQNIKLTIGYDGSKYHGFQLQKNAVTIQECLERAMHTVFCHPVRVIAAGRTDSGVHAEGQVVNFRAASQIAVERIPYALNSVLPRDIVVSRAEKVSELFHARYSAVSKVYTYTVDNAPHPRVLLRHYSLHLRVALDLALMKNAAATLLGRHDFSSFMGSASSVKTAVRQLLRLEIAEADGFITITAEANGFLYNMMRIIVGTLVEVGLGKREADLLPLLQAKDRNAAGWTVPPHGLILREVKY